ncbi:S1C family serine protease [Rhizobacter sp. Root404]|uniref:S1C family serine protease n=1 Tax=Rhizobacter sp. Root404 TaxID=1736528 RepID=UPI0006F9D58E|nr:trypsin-like peptidase domain-containing protein [Rhizobacter sp. Root404]KQW37930.1 peptidase S1 [Rhizobacter sp. Root404]
MKKAPLYSRSRPVARTADPGAGVPGAEPATAAPAPATVTRRHRLKTFVLRNERRVWGGAVLLLIAAGVALTTSITPQPPALTIAQIDAAMRKSIEEKPLPSPVSAAYDAILPSVVRVVGLMTEGDDGTDREEANEPPKDDKSAKSGRAKDNKEAAKLRNPVERGIGTGVVIIDNGTILTNLHVVNGARRIKVTFMDGTESDAIVLSTQPQNDLAVLRAKTIPDDLAAATLRSTADLSPGDHVLAVGFPFGIGPSASSGIVSGLKREFRSPEGKHTMTNLIQFDAAANPGNSGGPLVTMDGEVVGIVTAILNPSQQRTFIGIGFAVPIENAAAAVGMPPF